MPSPERGLITSIIDSGHAELYLSSIRPDWFFDVECKRAWGVIASHYEAYRESITRPMLAQQLPGFTFERFSANVEALSKIVQDRWLHNAIAVMQEDVSKAIGNGGDARQLMAEMSAKLSSLMAQSSPGESDTDIAATAGAAVERYHYRKTHQDEIGLPFPWAPMQRAAHGARNGSFIVMFARQKSMKTFVMMYILKFWRYHFHRRVLFITREMPPEELQDRDLCLWAEVDYGRFESGELNPQEEEALAAAAEAMAEVGGFIIEQIQGHGSAAVAEIAALLDKYDMQEGDILAVDGMYFFAGDSEWQKFRAFSQGLKKLALAKERKIIVIATSQANRNFTSTLKGDSGKEMGMGDAPVQDCDITVKLALDSEDNQIHMMMGVLRRGKPCEWVINALPCTDFSLKMSDAPDQDRAGFEDLKDAPIIGARKKLAEKATITGMARKKSATPKLAPVIDATVVTKKSAAPAATKKPSTPPAVAGGTRKKKA